MKIGVLGAGAWGTALAHVARARGHEVAVWSRSAPDTAALRAADALILAVPAQSARRVLTTVREAAGGRPLIIAAKGIERDTGCFMAELAGELLPGSEVLVLSGPSFAADVLRGLPTAVVLAGGSVASAGHWAAALALPHFRIYASDDVVGVEVGGALKNVLAIACGIADGRGLGDSARAALTTRGFAELMRFGRKLGARPETLTGLSGLGDLLLTCSSRQSRNYAFGHEIGRGASAAEAMGHVRGVVEGAHTVAIAHAMARRLEVVMPIVAAVHGVVDEGAAPVEVIDGLLSRPLGQEFP